MKYFLYVIIAILVNFGLFPAEFSFMPYTNTKMIMAGMGLLLLCIQRVQGKNQEVSRDFFIVSIFAALVSIAGVISTGYNGTSDYTYVSYIISMWVWCGSSYLIIYVIKAVHHKVSFWLVSNYLILVCVVQCLIALAISLNPIIKSYIDSVLVPESLEDLNGRLYGICCSLDVAGTRFAAVLVIIAALCVDNEKVREDKILLLYVIAYIVIAVIGNMISRTTIIGVGLSLIYWIFRTGLWRLRIDSSSTRFLRYMVFALLTIIPITVYEYYYNSIIYQNLRFAFEGFFSLIEKGYWETHSNNRLMEMVVYPTDLKTWIIGDGYFNNPLSTNPYYTGRGIGSYYMNTDIGYLRFIFYFGAIGLLCFVAFMCKVANVCMARFREYKKAILLLLFLNFIIWLKVSTDIFVIFSFFLSISSEEQESAKNSVLYQ